MAVAELAEGVLAGDRRALAQAITLAESQRLDHREQAEQLLTSLLPHTGGSHRVAITGLPGAGKSTLVDALGAAALEAGRRVAVLAVDPASSISGGSMLGDAVRMQRLAATERAFVRATSSSGVLGGTAPYTRDAVLLCEAAGFELVLIETVGVGQAEQAVRDVCDTLLVLTLAGAGDEIQGIKRGLFEVADAVLVSKADGDNQALAGAFAQQLQGALGLLRPSSAPHVAAVSAFTLAGVPELLGWLDARHARLRQAGELTTLRNGQLQQAFLGALRYELERRLRTDPRLASLLGALLATVIAGQTLPEAAARQLIEQLHASS